MEAIKDIISRLSESLMAYTWATPFIRVLVASDVFLVIFYIYRLMVRSDAGQVVLRFIDGRVQVSKGKFDWAGKKEKMISQGVEFYNPKFLQPHYYIIGNIVCAVILMFVIFVIAPGYCWLGIIGYFAPPFYFGYRDKKDNAKMGQDVMSISSAISIQVSGGEYLAIALAETKDVVQTPRLKEALEVFGRHIKCNDLTTPENIDELASKFTSDEILALCTIMKQGIETGQMVECARDLAKQCLNNRENAFDAKRAHLDRAVTIAMLLVFADGIGFIMWRFLVSLLAQF